MDLYFESPALQRLAETASGCAKLLGQKEGALLCQRLCELAAAENLATVRDLPALDFQQHASEEKFSVRIADAHRIFLVAVDVKSADLRQITTIRIIAIERT